jgi:hypothetical protein
VQGKARPDMVRRIVVAAFGGGEVLNAQLSKRRAAQDEEDHCPGAQPQSGDPSGTDRRDQVR